MNGETIRPKVTPKDFFLWLGAMAALYVSTISLITLWFEYINYLFPDELQSYVDPFLGTIRYSIASLVVIFPLYIFLTRFLNQEVRRDSAKKEIWVRRWVIYLTLFVAGITLVVDLIVLINTFLGGDLTTRFILKIVVVLVVIGAGFLYYLYDLRGRWEREEKQAKMIAGIVAVAVLASIVSGFFIIGSPQTQRLFRFDQQKVSDLQNIQWQVVSYWQQKVRLPATLPDLEDPISGFVVPKDSQTGAEYGYRVVSLRTFELCAVFNLETRSGQIAEKTTAVRPALPAGQYAEGPYGFESENWQHGVGETCFERTIDPDLFPPVKR